MLRDLTLTMLRRGYLFRSSVFAADERRTGVPIRFLGRPALFVTGEAGVRLFYDDKRMSRDGAAPSVVANLLFGRGGVQGLDGAAHRHRRQIFLETLDPAGTRRLTEVVRRRWSDAERRWVAAGTVNLHDAAVRVLGESVVEWAGASAAESTELATELSRLVDGFGSVGPANLRGRLARRRCEQWAADQVRAARRAGPAHPGEPASPLHVVARHRDLDGHLLDVRTAAVELLNLLRPVVAVAWFLDFAAIALTRWPDWRTRVGTDGDAVSRTAFVHEIRRYYPLTPLLAARARHDFRYAGCEVRAGDRVLLDVIGVNHDPSLWAAPWRFSPSRFEHREPGADNFVPQGGGPWEEGHRCPGEPTTVALLAECLRMLADLPFQVGRTDLDFPTRRVPTRPPRGPVLRQLGHVPHTTTGRPDQEGRPPDRPEENWTMTTHAELVSAVSAQHGRIAQLIRWTNEATESDRVAAFDELRRTLALHEAAEQETIHPLLHALGEDHGDVGRERVEEEQEASTLVARLESLLVTSFEFGVQLGLLEEAITFHATAEEQRELPRLVDASEADLRRAITALSTAKRLSEDRDAWCPGARPFKDLLAEAATLFREPVPQ